MFTLTFFLLVSFSISSSEYNFSCKKFDGIPLDMQYYDRNKLDDKNEQKNNTALSALNKQSVDASKIDYSFDLKQGTAVCVQRIASRYQIAFYSANSVCRPHKFQKQSSLYVLG